MAVWNSLFWNRMLIPIIDGAIFVIGCLIAYYLIKMIFHHDKPASSPK